MSMSTSPIFPVEVCERVISSLWCIHMLWSHYVRTLYNCALVCRAWAPTSRTCLYHTIRFGQGRRGIDENLHQLERTLVAHPHLSRLIREVQVIAPGLVMVPVAPHLQSVLALLSGKVPNLKSLRYRDTPFETHGGFWIHTPRLPLHRSFFINTFAFRTLEHLELSQTTFDSLRELLHILYRCPSLRRLCLDGVEVRRWNSDPIFTKLPPVAHLSVGGKNAIASGDQVPRTSCAVIKLFAPTVESLILNIEHATWEGVMQESDDGVPRVHLPRLTYLAISFSKDATWKAPSVLTSFMQRTEMPSLNWITLYYDRFPEVDSEAPLSGMVESFAHVHIIYRLDQKDYLGKSLRSVFGELSSQVSSTNDSIRSNYPRCHKRRVLRTTFTGGCDMILHETGQAVQQPLLYSWVFFEDGTSTTTFDGITYGEEVTPGLFLLPCSPSSLPSLPRWRASYEY